MMMTRQNIFAHHVNSSCSDRTNLPKRDSPMPTKKKPAKKTAKKAAKKASKKPVKKAKRKANPALMKPVQADAVLAVIVGSKPLPRGQMTKKLWDYIKKNKLQDAKKRTQINADANLQVVFGGKKQVSMFEMTKLVSKHVK
jgi:upstream activation factor subunit UAF30